MNHLKELRQKAGYKTVKQVATYLKICNGTLYQIEEGYKKPSVELAARMSVLYNCSLEEIFLPIITTNSDKVNRFSQRVDK